MYLLNLMRHLKFNSLSLLVFGFSLSLLAEEPMLDSAVEPVMSPTAEDDVRIVVSATRGWAQDPLDVPQAISTLSDKVLNETVYSNLEDALQRLPNIGLAQASQPFSARQGASTSSNYWQEGFSIRGLGGPRVLVLTDGIRQAGQGIGYGGGNLSLYDLYAIDRIEVLRGPASVMYGTDALGGVVSVTTREPVHYQTPSLHGRGRVSYDASRNILRYSAMSDYGDPQFACVVGASYTNAHTARAPKGASIDGGSFSSYGVWVKGEYLLGEHSRLRFLANTTQVEDVAVANRLIPSSYPSYLKIEIPMYSRNAAGVEWVAQDLSDALEEAKVGLFWQGLKRHFSWDAPFFSRQPLSNNSPTYIFREDRSFRFTDDEANTYELQPMLRFHWEPHTVTLGADIARDGVSLKDQRRDVVYKDHKGIPVNALQIGNVNKELSSTVAEAYQYRLGLYAQDHWDLHPFELIIGARADAFYVKDQLNDTLKRPSGLSGSLGSVYHWDEASSLYLNLASGFRVPDLGERFQHTTIVFFHPFEVFGNPNLKPERSWSAELGAKHRGSFCSFEVASFVNQIDNYIGYERVPAVKGQPIQFRYENLGGVLLYGFEAQASLFPIENWELYANTGRTFVASSDKQKIALPRWIVHCGTAYTQKISAGIIHSIKPEIRITAANSSSDTLNKVQYPGFGVLDAQISLGLDCTHGIEGSFIIGVKNILDKAYYLPFLGDPQAHTNAQPGRGVFTALELAF